MILSRLVFLFSIAVCQENNSTTTTSTPLSTSTTLSTTPSQVNNYRFDSHQNCYKFSNNVSLRTQQPQLLRQLNHLQPIQQQRNQVSFIINK